MGKDGQSLSHMHVTPNILDGKRVVLSYVHTYTCAFHTTSCIAIITHASITSISVNTKGKLFIAVIIIRGVALIYI